MHIADPRYVVPCRKTMMGILGQKYSQLKHIVHGEIAQQNCLSLTTDMWTSKTGAGYISVTSHFLTSDFQMTHRNLGTYPLPGHHNHSHIAVALRDLAEDWCIKTDDCVSAFTTDNA